MNAAEMPTELFADLLRYWRRRRGLSTDELSLAAELTPDFVEDLEDDEIDPGEATVLRLMSTLDVPLRARNDALVAAGHAPYYDEPGPEGLDAPVCAAVGRMLRQHDPYPMTVCTSGYELLQLNASARRVFGQFLPPTPRDTSAPLSFFELLFDPHGLRPWITNWREIAQAMLMRLHREALQSGGSAEKQALLERVLEMPGVVDAWEGAQAGVDDGLDPALTLRLERGVLRMAFFSTITTFVAPRQVTLDELRIEGWFPADEATRLACEYLSLVGNEAPRRRLRRGGPSDVQAIDHRE